MQIKDYISKAPIIFDFPYSSEYADEYLENMDLVNFRMRSKYGNLTAYQSDVETIGEDIRTTLFMNKYKYDTIYKTIKLEYNPIWNVDGTETMTTAHGATEKTDIFADKETTNLRGDKNSTDTTYVYPYDTEVKTPEEENEHLIVGTTDTSTEKGRTDKTTTAEYNDTITTVKGGNIGVTSTQSLISQERKVAMFSFWDIVISDVVKEITIPFYSEV